jgi:hypothetical protein
MKPFAIRYSLFAVHQLPVAIRVHYLLFAVRHSLSFYQSPVANRRRF